MSDTNQGMIVGFLSDTCEESTVVDDTVERQIMNSETGETTDRDDFNDKETVCIFCNTRRKKCMDENKSYRCGIVTKIDFFSEANPVK